MTAIINMNMNVKCFIYTNIFEDDDKKENDAGIFYLWCDYDDVLFELLNKE